MDFLRGQAPSHPSPGVWILFAPIAPSSLGKSRVGDEGLSEWIRCGEWTVCVLNLELILVRCCRGLIHGVENGQKVASFVS